jgi:hypothetical protein
LVTGLTLSSAWAEELPSYAPIDEQQWRDMSQYFYSLSMPGVAHAQIQEYMQRVQREAQMKQMRKQTEGRK